MATGEIKLKPCPFCGSKRVRAVSYYRPIDTTIAEIRCNGCGVELKATSSWVEDGLTERELLDKLAAMWNRRAEENGGDK